MKSYTKRWAVTLFFAGALLCAGAGCKTCQGTPEAIVGLPKLDYQRLVEQLSLRTKAENICIEAYSTKGTNNLDRLKARYEVARHSANAYIEKVQECVTMPILLKQLPDYESQFTNDFASFQKASGSDTKSFEEAVGAIKPIIDVVIALITKLTNAQEKERACVIAFFEKKKWVSWDAIVAPLSKQK